MQARPGFFQPGNFTDWGTVKGLKHTGRILAKTGTGVRAAKNSSSAGCRFRVTPVFDAVFVAKGFHAQQWHPVPAESGSRQCTKAVNRRCISAPVDREEALCRATMARM